MTVIYNSKKIIPAPFVSVEKEYVYADNGDTVGGGFVVTVRGTIVAFKGSPDSNGTFWTAGGYPADETIVDNERLKSILKKQEAIRGLFAEKGKLFEIQPLDGSTPSKFVAERLGPVVFEEGPWFDRCDWSIRIETSKIYGPLFPDGEDTFTNLVASVSETWSIENAEKPESVDQQQTYRLTHAIEAQGKPRYDVTGTLEREAWKEARNFVQSRLGIDLSRVVASGVLNLPSYFGGFNHVRSETVDEKGGIYSVSETWVVASGSALEDFSISVQTGNDDGRTRVSVEGTIEGLETRNSSFQITTKKYDAAKTKFDAIESQILSRAQLYSGKTLNASPLEKTVGRNPITGTITYNYLYDDRPSQLIANSKSETIVVTDIDQGDVFASIFVLGKTDGPVLQDLNTKTVKQRDLSIEVVMDSPGTNSLLSNKPDYTSVISTVKPGGTQVFQSPPVETWDAKNARGSYRTQWTYK